CHSVTVSSENAENVVNPPRSPVISKGASALPRPASTTTSSPIRNEPATFTATVPAGNPGPNSRPAPILTPWRATAPTAPPSATCKTGCIIALTCSRAGAKSTDPPSAAPLQPLADEPVQPLFQLAFKAALDRGVKHR